MFCGQRTKWLYDDNNEKDHIDVDQERGIDDLAEVVYDKKLDPDLACDADLHHQFRSGVGAVNWLQSRTQYQACYPFSRCASALAAPTTKDLEKLNKLIRQIRTDAVTLKYWPLPGFSLRPIGSLIATTLIRAHREVWQFLSRLNGPKIKRMPGAAWLSMSRQKLNGQYYLQR